MVALVTEVTGSQNVGYSACCEPLPWECIDGSKLPIMYIKKVGNNVDNSISTDVSIEHVKGTITSDTQTQLNRSLSGKAVLF